MAQEETRDEHSFSRSITPQLLSERELPAATRFDNKFDSVEERNRAELLCLTSLALFLYSLNYVRG